VRAVLPFEDRGTTVQIWLWFDRQEVRARPTQVLDSGGAVTIFRYNAEGDLESIDDGPSGSVDQNPQAAPEDGQ
jgi:hypothetical protein